MAEQSETKTIKKTPNPIDVHVGSRIRLRRSMHGMSQEKLGAALGITFQQVQKYEKGANRVGASRLQHIAEILDIPVSFFFEDAPAGAGSSSGTKDDEHSASSFMSFVATREGVHLIRAFTKIKDPKVRAKTLQLIKAIAED